MSEKELEERRAKVRVRKAKREQGRGHSGERRREE